MSIIVLSQIFNILNIFVKNCKRFDIFDKMIFNKLTQHATQQIMNFQSELFFRLAFFLGTFIVIGLWEYQSPCRKLILSKAYRWSANLGIVFLNTLVVRIIFRSAGVGIAIWAQRHGMGLFNYFQTTYIVAFILSFIILDFIIYFQHFSFHLIPFCWRFHKAHHADLDFDMTTALRFHPIEIVFSMLIKGSVIIILGAPAEAVILFEIVLNAMAMFNHGNILLPNKIDLFLRSIIVTPNMHRIHHSTEYDESNSNFGFNLSLWDRIFRSYRKSSRAGDINMEIGLSKERDPHKCNSFWGILLMPFTK